MPSGNIINAASAIGKFIQCAEAAAQTTNDLTKCDGVAYSGGEIRQWWSRLKMIVDLGGMEITPQTPLLLNHDNSPESKLGDIDAAIREGQLFVSGGIASKSEEAKHVIEMGREYNWQLSIGCEIIAAEEVDPEDSRTINGREFQGPFIHIKKTRLREVSVVAVGADPETSLQIAASLIIPKHANQTTNKGVYTMDKKLREFIQAKYNLGNCDEAAILAHLAKIGSSVNDETAALQAKDGKPATPPNPAPPKQTVEASAPVGMTDEQLNAKVKDATQKYIDARAQAEADRVEGIRAACGTDYTDLAEEAISAGYSAEDTKKIVAALKKQTKNIPSASGNIIIHNGPAINAKSLEAALALTHGIGEDVVVKDCGEQAVEAAAKLRGISLKGLAELCCRMEGKQTPVVFGDDTIHAAFSTISLPGILSNVANKRALQNFSVQPVIATRLCTWGDLNDFKESDRYRITAMGKMQKIAPDGEIKHSGFAEESAKNQIDTYGTQVTITRQMFYNDDLNMLMKVASNFGTLAAKLLDQLFFSRLLANPTMTDGYALFEAAHHKNYLTGTDTALSAAAIKVARSLYLKQTDKNGDPINILPKYLVCPSDLDALAAELVQSLQLTGGAAAGPALNIVSRWGLEVVSSPYLQNANYPGHSATGWYLWGDPNQIDTFELGCLQGKRTPTIEHSSTDFDRLGMNFRTFFDTGCREQEHRGIVFNSGVVA